MSLGPDSLLSKSDQEDAWLVSSNDALTIRLYNSSSSKDFHEFHPDFTYTQFGEEELIYGFRDLKIKIYFHAASLRPYMNVEYSEKRSGMDYVKTVVEPLLAEMFAEHNAPISLESSKWTAYLDKFLEWADEDRDFKPLGSKIHEYQLVSDNDTDILYEIYKCNFETPGFVEFHERLQVFLRWFIEGSSFIEHDLRWEIYCIWQKNMSGADSTFSLVGYWTVYPFYLFPDELRARISQAFVFPPHQSKGHGGMMYRFLYQHFMSDDKIIDFTVEDPSEAFSDLRFKNDLRKLSETDEKSAKDTEQAPCPKTLLFDADGQFKAPGWPKVDAFRLKFKFSKSHMLPLLEVYCLKHITPGSESYRKYRIWVKKRIYRKNEDVLSQMDSITVKTKLEETFRNVTEDYRRILNLL